MSKTSTMPVGKEAVTSQRSRIKNLTKIALLGAIAAILMIWEFPIPFMPVFLKFDFGDVPAVLATFSMGPLAGIAVQLIKNVVHLPMSSTMMVGELANFLIGSALVGVAGVIYQKRRTFQGAVLALACGTLAMTVVGALFNHFINIPFYIRVMGFKAEDIVGAARGAGNTLVTDLKTLILWVFVPFNIFKGLVVSLISSLIYKPLSPILKK